MTKEVFTHLGADLQIRTISCNDLIAHKTNPRTHSRHQVKQIARSIEQFGFNNPILIDRDNNIIAGHGRVEAARLMGLENVPVIYLNHLSEAQKRAYIIADNKLAENAGWNNDLLQAELEYITEIDTDFDLSLTGLEIPEIDLLLAEEQESDEADHHIPLPQEAIISQPGDLWLLGEHRLYCADATKPESYERLMGSQKAKMVFTDPPYNVAVNGHICGKGSKKHDEFKMASGEMSETEFTDFLTQAFDKLRQVSADGSLHYICMDWRHIKELMTAASGYTEFKNLCVWNKSNGGMGSLYRSKHELVFVYKNGRKPHLNNIELGRRKAYLLELDPKYCDVIIRRYQEFTGNPVTHEDGSTFNEKQEA